MLRPIRGNGKCPKLRLRIRYGIKECNTFKRAGDEVCIAKQDLVFSIDGNGSLRESGYKILKNFAASYIDKYEGEYVAGQREGKGTYHNADGTADVGRFKGGKDVGEGARWSADRATARALTPPPRGAAWTSGRSSRRRRRAHLHRSKLLPLHP